MPSEFVESELERIKIQSNSAVLYRSTMASSSSGGHANEKDCPPSRSVSSHSTALRRPSGHFITLQLGSTPDVASSSLSGHRNGLDKAPSSVGAHEPTATMSTMSNSVSSRDNKASWRGPRKRSFYLIVLLLVLGIVLLLFLFFAAAISLSFYPSSAAPKLIGSYASAEDDTACRSSSCHFGAKCLVDRATGKAYCRCHDDCGVLAMDPVCGSNNLTFNNRCYLALYACKQQMEISLLYEGSCDPCKYKSCPRGSACQTDQQGGPLAKCVCDHCPRDTYSIVCGTDSRTYPSPCELTRAACLAGDSVDIKLAHDGPCHGSGGGDKWADKEAFKRPCEASVSRVYCDDKELCFEHLSNGTMKLVCECPTCEDDDNDGRSAVDTKTSTATVASALCASDGNSYATECLLRRHACLAKTSIYVLYKGQCRTCEAVQCHRFATCELNPENGEPECICPKVCLRVDSPVCGNNLVTYNNECELRMASCRTGSNVSVEYLGPCDLCPKITCRFGAVCAKGHCVCPQDCHRDLFDPICANDGTTYHNMCHMRQISCLYEKDIELVFYGECKDKDLPPPLTVDFDQTIVSAAPDLEFTSAPILSKDRMSAALNEVDTESSHHDQWHLSRTGAGLEGILTDMDVTTVEGSQESCSQLKCNYGGECAVDSSTGLAFCSCKFECGAKFHGLSHEPSQRKFIFVSSYFHQVCGSDGQFHENECVLKERACATQTDIRVQEDKFCDPSLRASLQTAAKNPSHPLNPPCAKSEFGCCIDGVTTAPAPRYAGCPETCSCYKHGSYGLTCDHITKQCRCKPGTGGLKCDRCEAGFFWGLRSKIPEGNDGCLSCDCNPSGSVRGDCEQTTGKCVCKPGVRGIKCQHCPPGTVLSPRGCAHGKVAQPVPGRSCKELNCQFGARCLEEASGAQCLCDTLCAKSSSSSSSSSTSGSGSNSNQQNLQHRIPLLKLTYQPLCGSDGETYFNECQLAEFSCRYQKNVSVVREGPC